MSKQKQAKKVKEKAYSVRLNGVLLDVVLEFNKGEMDNYNMLLAQIADHDIKSSEIYKLCQDSILHAHLLDKRHSKLVKALLQVKWMEREDKVILKFHDFVIALVTTNPIHLRHVMTSLAACFQGVQSQESIMNAIDIASALNTVHRIFQTIFSTIPQSFPIAEAVFASGFPFRTKPLSNLESYTSHLLRLTTYQVKLRPSILEHVLKNLVQLDVHAPKHEIEESDYEEEDKEEDIFQLDEEMHCEEKWESPDKALTMKHDQANKLDRLLQIFYQYLYDVCFQNGELQLEEARKLFREIVSAFDKVVLPIYQLNHVQFALFYLCSFKQSFYDSFIDHCWKIVIDNNASSVIRQTSVCYIASLLARANYISLSTAKACLETMSTWCHGYLKRVQESQLPSYSQCDPVRHGPFYSVCQAILYIIVFRHRQILDSKQGYAFIQSLNLQHLIVSPLNPLKICLSSIVTLFASTMRTHQIVFCDSIIERNNRQVVPVVGSVTSEESQVNQLESFFPFDPYMLKRSCSFVERLYTEWTGNVPSSMKDLEDTHDEEFLDAVEEGSLAMSVKEFALDLPSLTSSSPGFEYFTQLHS